MLNQWVMDFEHNLAVQSLLRKVANLPFYELIYNLLWCY